MFDNSVLFPPHIVNLNNCTTALRCPSGSLGDGKRPYDAAMASFASHGDEPTEQPAFQPVRDTLAEIAPTPTAGLRWQNSNGITVPVFGSDTLAEMGGGNG